ncbi:MAG TPA: lipopolysaccharide heptosyltransferase II [Chthoniobacteraceae bacterium]|nr:lipopolysaccharide heptosyltransferase II [Chthoniobacteraceae bacterium]
MDRFVFVAYRTASVFLRALPLKLVWWIGRAFGYIGYFLGGKYRRLALHNLWIAFGDQKPKEELRSIACDHFASLGANFLSGLTIGGMPKEALKDIVEFEGLENVQRVIGAGQGCVMVISHIGNWELFSQLFPLLFSCPLGTIYQRLGNPFIDAEVRSSRARLGVELFERKEGFQGAIRTLRAGGIVGVLIDQHAGDAGVWCPFFGRLASTSSLAAMLALRTGAALVPGAVYSAGLAQWRLVIDPVVTPTERDTDSVTAQLNVVLEGQIRRQPADWFWVHNRWKTPRPNFLLSTYKRGIVGTPIKAFRILIRSTNWLGDAVMTIPAVRAFKRGRPDAHVTILTPAKLADLWKAVEEVDDVISIESDESVFSVASRLRKQFDVAVLFPNSLRTALEAWLGGIPRRVGYAGHSRRWLLNQVFREKKAKRKTEPPKHQVYHYLNLAEYCGANLANSVEASSSASGRTKGRVPRIGVVPGAEYGPAKRWLPERFAEVIRSIHEETGAEWRMYGVAKDRPVADRIFSEGGIPCADLVGKTTLSELIAELRACDILVTNDTGTMHLAASLGVTVVAIFGSTEPELTGPLGSGHVILRKKVECAPCFLRECPIDFRCMKAIEARQVIEAIKLKLAVSL